MAGVVGFSIWLELLLCLLLSLVLLIYHFKNIG
jgi:hypothetical protein